MKYVLNYQGIRGGHCILLGVKFLAAIWPPLPKVPNRANPHHPATLYTFRSAERPNTRSSETLPLITENHTNHKNHSSDSNSSP